MGDKPRVLVVDDEVGVRESLRILLKPTCEVALAESGEAALQILETFPADLVFLDIKMPTMNGLELLRRIKAHDPKVEVVMVTAHASLETLRQSLADGAFEYLIKPFSRRELEETTRRALARRRGYGADQGQVRSLVAKMRSLTSRSHELEEAAQREALEQSLRVAQFSILREISRGILGQLDLTQMTQTITDSLKAGLGYDDVSILLGPEPPRPAEGAAIVACPILEGETTLGLLVVNNRHSGRAIDPRERELLSMLSEQMAIAVRNSRLYEDLRLAHEDLQRTSEKLVQSERLRALGEMAGGVAHDFNNLLAVILGRTQILLTKTDNSELQRQLQVIQKAALDGAQVVRRIQEFSRLRRARPFQTVDVNRVFEEVMDMTRARWEDDAQAQGISYDVVLETTEVPPVPGDPSELREALTNVVLNAIDAMPRGGRVTLQTGVQGERVCCVVTDTGIGMSDDVKQRVFDPFFTTKGEKGTGLGLSVVYGIITRHGGEIEVQSEVGRGSAFTIRLPVEREAPSAPDPAPLSRPHRHAKILVIEDEQEVRDTLHDLLTDEGHSVATCADGESALIRLQEETFDLVLTDLAMPKLTGWQVASLVKLRSPATPVAMVTGWGDQINSEEARVKGVDFLVAKPFNLEDVIAVVARALIHKDLGTSP